MLWCEKALGFTLVLADVLPTLVAGCPIRKQASKGVPEPPVGESPSGTGYLANGPLLWGLRDSAG